MPTFSLPVVTLIVFAAIATIIGAVMLVVRDLAVGNVGTPQRQRSLKDLRLRPPADEDRRGTLSPIRWFDGWLDRLMFETGLELSPMSGALVALLAGIVAGGGIFLWDENPVGSGLAFVAGLGAAFCTFAVIRIRRLNRIREQLPDVIDQIGRAVRAGESVDQAFALAAARMKPPLAAEFRRCTRQLELGVSLPTALRSFQQRVRVMETQIFVTTLTIHRESGGNLPLTLERMANMMRDRLSYRRQVRATTAAGRVTAGLLSLAGPLMFLYFAIFRSAALREALSDGLGQLLFALAIVLEIVGLIWVYAVSRDQTY